MSEGKQNGVDLVAELVGRCKMTHQEIADYVGVTKYVVTLWKQGKSSPNQQNYEKLVDMVGRLKGRDVYFPRMAMSVLEAEDYELFKKEL